MDEEEFVGEDSALETSDDDDDAVDTARDVDIVSAGGATARSVQAQERLRQQMAREVEEFLARGGKIQVVEPSLVSDPPRKPRTNYGGQPV